MKIIDTDILSDIFAGVVRYGEKLNGIEIQHRGIGIVTVEETLRGRLATVRKYQMPDRPVGLITAYNQLELLCSQFTQFIILPYTAAAHDIFQQLKSQKIRVGTQDLRIASIALAHEATPITRNRRDYEVVPSLKLEVWN